VPVEISRIIESDRAGGAETRDTHVVIGLVREELTTSGYPVAGVSGAAADGRSPQPFHEAGA